MKQHTFDKFINKEKGSKKKEALRQEKRKWKDERNKKYQLKNSKQESKSHNREIRNENFDNDFSTQHTRIKSKTTIGITGNRKPEIANHNQTTQIPLNKLIAHAGV